MKRYALLGKRDLLGTLETERQAQGLMQVFQNY